MLASASVLVSRTLTLFVVLYTAEPDCRHVLSSMLLVTYSACSTRFAAHPVTMAACSSYIRKD
jgi:hypothetical protein